MTRVTNRCSVCHKQLGTSYCTGCGVYFCTQDFKNHRGHLFYEMDTLITHRNDLQNRINSATRRTETNSVLFAQIDDWQKMMIEKVKIVAEHTRGQVTELLNSKRTKLTNDFKRFSQELVELKQTENFVEHDLSRLKYMIHQFNQELKLLQKPLTIVLHTEMTDRLVWSRLIYAEEVSTYAGLQSRRYELG